jgi:hypothetical protein
MPAHAVCYGHANRREVFNETTDYTSDSRNEDTREEQIHRNQAVIELLNAWEQEDAEEQRETVEYLIRVLDEDRTSSRPLFPPNP